MYQALADKIRASIRSGKHAHGAFVGSEHELARNFGVARMTLRRASTVLINEGVIHRVPGKGLFVRAPEDVTRQIQVIAGNLNWETSMQVWRGVQSVARESGIEVQLYDAHGDTEYDLSILRKLPHSQAQGAIIMAVHSSVFHEAVLLLKLKDFPFVLVDQQADGVEVSSVVADNYAGGYAAGGELLKRGHRRIAFIGDLVAGTVRRRLDGLRDAFSDAGVPFDRTLVFDLQVQDPLGDWSAQVDESARRAMDRPLPPTAIFCSCDAVARPVYRALATLGQRVPEDVSIIGFDDAPLAEMLTPPLTTVRQPFFEIGKTAMETLCRQMSHPGGPVERHSLPVELVMRNSVAEPIQPGGIVPPERQSGSTR
jgi:DNA-binding LacI/PurR family transcriptional regulator